uniref:Protein yippee-like n=1 Tax=Myripristis murdjan TaxID=586833 RepID=A0A667YIW1_9TELE
WSPNPCFLCGCENLKMEFDASVLMHRTDDIKLAMEAERRSLMTLHCEQCNTVLGDSLGVCGELKSLDSILCLKSSVPDSYLLLLFTFSICSSLKCSGCRRVLGTVIHSAPQHLAMLRSIFLLHKANISCYILNSSTMVKASTLSFDMKPIGESINEVRL